MVTITHSISHHSLSSALCSYLELNQEPILFLFRNNNPSSRLVTKIIKKYLAQDWVLMMVTPISTPSLHTFTGKVKMASPTSGVLLTSIAHSQLSEKSMFRQWTNLLTFTDRCWSKQFTSIIFSWYQSVFILKLLLLLFSSCRKSSDGLKLRDRGDMQFTVVHVVRLTLNGPTWGFLHGRLQMTMALEINSILRLMFLCSFCSSIKMKVLLSPSPITPLYSTQLIFAGRMLIFIAPSFLPFGVYTLRDQFFFPLKQGEMDASMQDSEELKSMAKRVVGF